MNKKWIFVLACTIFIATLFGYGFKSFGKDKPKITVVLKASDSQYWEIMIAGIERAFDQFGVEGKILAPDMNGEDQITILKKVLKEEPQALIFSPIDTYLSVPVLKEYKKQNIPVLLIDTGVNWSDQTSFIGTHNLTLGKKGGELLTSMLNPGSKIAIIGRVAKDPVSDDRIQGAKEALNKVDMVSIERKIPFNAENSTVIPVMDKIIQSHPDIDGVYATDDGLAIEVLKVLDKHKLKLPVVGADGITEMINYIKEGTLLSTVAQNPYDMGYISVQNALKAINGEKVDKRIDSGVDIINIDNAKNKLQFLEKILKD